MSARGKVKFYDFEKKRGSIEWKGEKDVYFGRGSFKEKPPSIGDWVEFKLENKQEKNKAIKVQLFTNMLPDDTWKLVKQENINNFNLKLNKAARFENGKFKFFKTDNRGKVICQIKPNFSEDMIKAISKRYYDSIQNLNLKLSESLTLKPDWRLIVGLGNESIYETSMTLHHIYGFPYIPGSAIKGVTRNYYINDIYDRIRLNNVEQINIIEKILENFKLEKDNNLEYKIFKSKFAILKYGQKVEPKETLFNYFSKNTAEIINFQNIFGTLGKIGKIIFFDAFPLEPPHIEPDIMNSHYNPYYSDTSEKVPPADYHNPNPIFFLTVKTTPFKFIIGIKEKDNIVIKGEEFEGKTSIEVAHEYMRKALSEHGIGAKTAVGYGYFEAVSKDYEIEHMTEKQKKEAKENKRTGKGKSYYHV